MPTTAEEYLIQGRKEHQQRHYPQAIEAYSKALELDPTRVHAAINANTIYLELKDYSASMLMWSKLKPSSNGIDLKKFIVANLVNCPDAFFQEYHTQTLHPKLLSSKDMGELKSILLERLDAIQDPKIKFFAKVIALLPNSFTGSIFYYKRGATTPSLKGGKLHDVANSLEADAKTYQNGLELPPPLLQALQQQSSDWQNTLKSTFPILHFFLLHPKEAAVQAASAAPAASFAIHTGRPPAYNPRADRFAASAPSVTELSRPLQPFTDIETLLQEAERLQIDLSDIKTKYICPLSKKIMRDPTVAADGYTYDRTAIVAHINANNSTSPKTQEELPHLHLSPNQDYRQGIFQYLQRKLNRLADIHTSQLLRASSAAFFTHTGDDLEPGSLQHEGKGLYPMVQP